MGAETKLKAWAAGDQNRRAPPPGTGKARLSGNHPPAPPAGFLQRRLNQCRAGSVAGMQGAKPLA